MSTHIARPRLVAIWLVSATLVAGSPIVNSAATAESPTPATYVGHQVIDLATMEQMRGGFSFAGMEVKFGATLSTLIDNIKLETVFNITSAGAEIVSQMMSNLAAVNESVAAISQNIAIQKSELMSSAANPASTSTVTGPVAGVTATGTPSALQPSVPAQQLTTVPSSTAQTALAQSPHSTAAPIVNNPINSAAPTQQPSIATATAGSSPSATVHTPITTVQSGQPAGSLTTSATSSAQQPAAQIAATTIVTTPSQPNATTTQSNGGSAVLVGQGTGTSLAELTPVDIDLSGVSDDNGFSGIVVSNNKGFTAALHKLTQDAAISAVISNASQLKVSQKLNIKINIANAKSAQQASMRAALSKASAGIFR
ncbi:MAG: hypothetical protein V7707_19740 [Motiliproteus sp.]